MNLKIISAGAGSGKTYRLTSEMVSKLKDGARASGIIATTFTKKAAAELQERVRVKLLEEGMNSQADELTNALIGTVHGLGVKLLRRFAFEAGVSPEVDIIADEDQQLMFNQALATVLTHERIQVMEHYSNALGLTKREYYDWRKEVKMLTDVARSNDFSIDLLEESKLKSYESFSKYLGKPSKKSDQAFNQELLGILEDGIQRLEQNADETKTTRDAGNTLKAIRNRLKLKGQLYWHEWVKIGKIKVGAKSREDVAELVEYAWTHETHPAFHEDIQQFIYQIFDIAIAALKEYDEYKKRRGLIDYIDMEIQVKRLLDHPDVKAVLSDELDLLMVDEFQDTSPIQLEIFLKLARLAKDAVWVGDPKQSIYGFRGADPKLMKDVITWAGGVKEENIQTHSWRSREDIVYATNALFSKAFDHVPVEQVALEPKRCKIANSDSKNENNEPIEMGDALIHYHFTFEKETGKRGGSTKTWFSNCLAEAVKELLEGGVVVQQRGEEVFRPVQAGDMAILCRSNKECLEMAEALHRAGLKAAISRSGLLNTAEAKLILACLKYILNEADSLSVAEILLLADKQRIEDIIDNRLAFLSKAADNKYDFSWGKESPIIQHLGRLREETTELSSTEILNLVLAELDLRRIIVSWGNVRQRMDNVDVLRRFALQYEEGCNRLHTAASLGGFLLYLNDLQSQENDKQGSGEGMDAVQVMTYHRSKGLEWPVVFCHALETKLRDDVWGVGIVSEAKAFDINDVLGNRWIRYWVNPYSDQRKGTPLQERIAESPEKKETNERALAEEARLLYVGITRARDYLVIPTREKPSTWLNRVWHKGKGDLPTLDEHTPESPWEWKKQFLMKRTEVRSFPKDFTAADLEVPSITYFDNYAGKDLHHPFEWDLRLEGLKGIIKVKTGTTIQYGSPIPHHETANQYQIGKMLKAFLTADDLDYPSVERQEMVQGFLKRYELEGLITDGNVLYQSEQFYSFLQKTFNYKKLHRKYPIYHYRDDRKFETIIDIILETEQGLILIQNSGFTGEKKQWKNKALKELADWMHMSKSALQVIFKTEAIQTYAHFVMGSGLIELVTNEGVGHKLQGSKLQGTKGA